MDEILSIVIDNCWEHYTQFKSVNPTIVNPSIPVLWLGDIDKYLNSKIKIVTVDSNPSRHEFPPLIPFLRFEGGEKIYDLDKLDAKTKQNYKNILSEYFKNELTRYPSHKSFDILLKGIGASYNTNCPYKSSLNNTNVQLENTAIHINFYTPLSTTHLHNNSKDFEEIKNDGFDLWIELIDYLKPDLIITSFKPSNLSDIKSKLNLKTFNMEHELHITYTDHIYADIYKCNYKSHNNILLYGTKGRVPFGSIPYKQRFKLGQILKDYTEIS